MEAKEIPGPGAEQVFRPCGRAFFVYYVAMFIVFAGPRINPAVGLPVWLGTVLGLILVAAVVYMKYGQEYRLTSTRVAKVWRWPARRQEIVFKDIEEVFVLKGLTQSLLQVGNLLIKNKGGGGDMFWFGLMNPKEVKALIDGRRA
jgi:hypothetical protein